MVVAAGCNQELHLRPKRRRLRRSRPQRHRVAVQLTSAAAGARPGARRDQGVRKVAAGGVAATHQTRHSSPMHRVFRISSAKPHFAWLVWGEAL